VLAPLFVLAFFSFFAGFAGLPQIYGDWFRIENSNSFSNFVGPALAHGAAHHLEHGTEYAMTAGAIAMSGVGLLLAWVLYVRQPELPARIRGGLGGVFLAVRDKYYVDEAYDAVIVRPLVAVSDRVLFRVVDAGLIDGAAVNGAARSVRALAAHGLKYAQSGLAQSYIFFMIVGAAALLGYLLR
jgi:NADH-quinone oxidoreductase subunit L